MPVFIKSLMCAMLRGLRRATLTFLIVSRAILAIRLLRSTCVLSESCPEAEVEQCGSAGQRRPWGCSTPLPPRLLVPLYKHICLFGFQSLSAKREKTTLTSNCLNVETTDTDRHIYKVYKATKPKGWDNALVQD